MHATHSAGLIAIWLAGGAAFSLGNALIVNIPRLELVVKK